MKKRTGALLLALVMLLSLMAPAASAAETDGTVEAVYLGIEGYGTVTSKQKDDFVHRFFADGQEMTCKVSPENEYALQNQLMEGYIYDVTVTGGTVTEVALKDKGTITMGTVDAVGEGTLTVDGQAVDTAGLPVYAITTAAGGASVETAEIAAGDTVKITDNAVYKAFVAEEYTAPVNGTPGQRTLKNFLTTALTPVGTALYVYGGAWDWEDSESSNQAMTIGIPQSWIDFFQSQDETYTYRDDGDKAHSYYPHNSWNQYYYAGVDCSAYTGWVVYNTMNTESATVDEDAGYVSSSTKQAQRFANEGWGTMDMGVADAEGKRHFDDSEFKVGDIFSMNGHVWICLGTCEDGSIVFMHSTPSENNGAGIQISAIGENKDCMAYQLADHYMETYYPVWAERYDALLKSFDGYTLVTGSTAGKFSWNLDDTGLTDPDGYADMTPTQILGSLYADEFVPEAPEVDVPDDEPGIEADGLAVYLGVADYGTVTSKQKDEFDHRFFLDGKVQTFKVDTADRYAIQNQLMEGYIYDITAAEGVVTAVELLDKGHANVVMGTVTAVDEGTLTVDGKQLTLGDGVQAYEITTAAGGAEVLPADIAKGDTVKVIVNDTEAVAVYKAFVAEEYTAPVNGTPGVTTLKNFLTTALTPVGTALYVYGGTWDWQDSDSSNQAMTIGIPQSWIDFFQSHDETYHYKNTDAANSYYPFNSWNQYYYAGVDCSAYVGWVVYNTKNTESATVADDLGYVGSSTKQALRFSNEGWGTMDMGVADENDKRHFDDSEFKVGDVFSMNGHVWICLGTCSDGSIVFMHSTPSENNGAGIQISAIGESKDCEAYQLASKYMEKYYPAWAQRYDALLKSFDGYTVVSGSYAGKFSWNLDGTGLLTDPDGYADMTPAEILADIYGEVSGEAVYLGVEGYGTVTSKQKDDFDQRFFMDGEIVTLKVSGKDNYALQNQLMEGYIYDITAELGVVQEVTLKDKGTITMGTVDAVGEGTLTVDGKTVKTAGLPVYAITTAAGGASVETAEIAAGDTVKITDNAVYKAFVAKEYTAPVNGTPGVTTLKNFLTTALTPVGTALYVYGGTWDWQDSDSSNQAMTIGIPQSWIDFFQSQDASYTYKNSEDKAHSYYPHNSWNQYYYAGVDCSAYVGWVVYNTKNTESATVANDLGYVGSSTKQALRFSNEGWGTMDMGVADENGKRHFDDSEFKVGDVFSMNGHVWICLGTCSDGSIVFMHSTPSENNGAGIQISAIGENKFCQAYKLASRYMEKYYPAWAERYDALLKDFDAYTVVSGSYAGKFSWNLDGTGLLTDPDGYADMTPAEILADIYGETSGGSSKPAIRPSTDDKPVTPVTPAAPEATFQDVPKTHWASQAVEFVAAQGLFNGVSADTFAPDAATTRAQLMTVLARAAKADTTGDALAKGMEWAVANGISDGSDPSGSITREQLVTMLYRYAVKAGMDVSVGEDTNILSYDDALQISEWAIPAMQWACGAGIINGTSASTLSPNGLATRAQVAAMMQRFCQL